MPRVAEQTSRENPKVSVNIITYNHEKFIAQTVESVLMQETDFPIELIIGEDCSADGTRQIVKAYAEKYPNVIRVLFPERNLGMLRNFAAVLEASGGEYIAFCEGDDYWTDSQKLQRQVEFMEANPEMSLCHHVVEYVRWDGGSRNVLQTMPPESFRQTQQAKDLIGLNFIHICSVLVRRPYLPIMDTGFQRLKLGDWPICYLAAEHGGSGFLDAVMADYRIHGSNNWISLENDVRDFEAARMALYLAGVAQPEAQAAWHRFGIDLLNAVLKRQSTCLGATRKASAVWRSGCLPFPQVSRLLISAFANRAVVGLHRHPRAVAVLKRLLRPCVNLDN